MAEQQPTEFGLTAFAVAVVTAIGVLIPALLEPNSIAIAGMAVSLGIIVAGAVRSRPSLLVGGSALAVIFGFYFWSPFWHFLFYGMTHKFPGSLQWLLVGLAIALIGFLLGAYRVSQGASDTGFAPSALMVTGIGIAVVGFLLVGWIAGGIYAQEDMSQRVLDDVQDVEELPEVDAENRRSLPEAVALNYAQNSLQTPRYELAGGDITVINETPHWSYSLAPDGGYNSWRIQQDGAVYVSMSTQNKDVDVVRQEFRYGQGQIFFDNYGWQLLRQDYNHDYQDPFIVKHDGELHMAVPYMDWDREFRTSPIPQFYAVPEFGGVKMIDRDGTIEDLSPAEAQSDARLAGQNIYPYDLARFQVESTRYQHGALNKWFTHEDQLELAEVPGQGNDQPFTVITKEDGITYFLAAEPYGADTHGIYQIWTVDARSGELERKTYDIDNSLLGPTKATRFVRQEHPNYQWADGEGGNIETSEPIPVIVDGTLYWQVFVVPTDSAGVAQVSFVNADSGAVTSVETDDEIGAFLRGQVDDGSDNTSDERPQDGDNTTASLTITVEYPDGSTETIAVPEGATVSVEHANVTASG